MLRALRNCITTPPPPIPARGQSYAAQTESQVTVASSMKPSEQGITMGGGWGGLEWRSSRNPAGSGRLHCSDWGLYRFCAFSGRLHDGPLSMYLLNGAIYMMPFTLLVRLKVKSMRATSFIMAEVTGWCPPIIY